MADDVAPARGRRRFRPSGALAGVVPFFAYTTVFLLVPTLVVVVGAFLGPEGGFTTANLEALTEPGFLTALRQSLVLSAVTAVLGAVIGGVLAYAVSTSPVDGVLRRFLTSLCGVLAQFGGVALAFAFMATFVGSTSILGDLLTSSGIDSTAGAWLYTWDKGLMLVYLYFQIPLMLIVFLPAVEGLRPQWREATETLGGTTWTYWRRVALPILWPSFVGATLLLFTNGFSAYATARALVSQGSPLVTLKIDDALSSEVVLGQQGVAKAMALAMVVVVAVVMVVYGIVDRRASRWLQR
ncbi:MAG TPA: ABC transporter permease [Humibacillus xanthopallidus]|nr:ABC transporter permease [Humibacillus xanthopallidus]